MLLYAHAQPDAVDVAFSALGVRRGMRTCPSLVREVIDEDFRLGDFAPFAGAAAQARESRSLDPLLDGVGSAIRRRHPALRGTLEAGVREGLFATAAVNPAAIERVLHRMYVLELVVREMVASPDFCVQLQRHYAARRRELGGGRSRMGAAIAVAAATRNAFETAKYLTVDATFAYYLGLRGRPRLPPAEVHTRGRGLRLNLYEAVLTDRIRGHRANARAGRDLARPTVPDLSVEGPDRAVLQRFEDGWTSRYHAWNLAFVCGNVGNADWMLPKLLIPSVIDAEPERYLHHRVLALWVSVQALYFHRLATGERDPAVTPELAAVARRLARVGAD